MGNHTASVFRVTMNIVGRNTSWEQVGRIEKEENVLSPPPPQILRTVLFKVGFII
jgi:hypothetical protein